MQNEIIELKQSKDQTELRIGKISTQIDNQQSVIDQKANFKELTLLNKDIKDVSDSLSKLREQFTSKIMSQPAQQSSQRQVDPETINSKHIL